MRSRAPPLLHPSSWLAHEFIRATRVIGDMAVGSSFDNEGYAGSWNPAMRKWLVKYTPHALEAHATTSAHPHGPWAETNYELARAEATRGVNTAPRSPTPSLPHQKKVA
jgi:hypothetical protein